MAWPEFDPHQLFDCLERSWPPSKREGVGSFDCRDGAGGGQRVGAITRRDAAQVSPQDLDVLEAYLADVERPVVFSLRQGDEHLDALLAARGYVIKDPTLLLTIETARLPLPDAADGYVGWPPLAVQREIWASGGVDAARLAVMDRVQLPKTSILARKGNAVAGTAFVARVTLPDGAGCAVIHAVETLAALRRQGVGRAMLAIAAQWADENDAAYVALLVTRDNSAARTLYTKLGMQAVAQYHYRVMPAQENDV